MRFGVFDFVPSSVDPSAVEAARQLVRSVNGSPGFQTSPLLRLSKERIHAGDEEGGAGPRGVGVAREHEGMVVVVVIKVVVEVLEAEKRRRAAPASVGLVVFLVFIIIIIIVFIEIVIFHVVDVVDEVLVEVLIVIVVLGVLLLEKFFVFIFAFVRR